jgi:hypothetical protein
VNWAVGGDVTAPAPRRNDNFALQQEDFAMRHIAA